MSLGAIPLWLVEPLVTIFGAVVDLVQGARARDQAAIDDAAMRLAETAAAVRERQRFG